MVEHRDYEHEAYLRRYYNSQQDRPELYHLLINTGLFPFDLAAKLIKETIPLVGAFSGAEGTGEPSKTTAALREEPPDQPEAEEADDSGERTEES